jgi:hypothetical protein
MKYLLAGTVALATYRAVMRKDGGSTAIRFDLLFPVGFGIAAPLFKRTLCPAVPACSKNALDKPLSMEPTSDTIRINRELDR